MDLLLPRENQARLDFVEGVKTFVATALVPSLRRSFEARVAEEEPDEASLRDRRSMAARLEGDRLYQASRGLQRISQEAMWREVRRGLETRQGELEAELSAEGGPAGGTLELAPGLAMPRYYEANEFHLQPGNYQGHPLSGPIYELGVATYTLHRYGRAGDEMGRALLSVLPERRYRRILYLGCGPGYKAYPVVDAFPDAEVHGIDLSAPMLRFAHRRAEEHGRRMHFRQMNAEALSYPDGSFDLVFCKLLLHEMPQAAVRNVLREACRVLAPGGVFANLELPAYSALDPLSAYLMDWDTQHNGEPYWRAYHEMDLEGACREAGFDDARTVDAHSEWGGGKGSYMGSFRYHVTFGLKAERG